MSPRLRWVVAALIAAAVFAVLVWLDTNLNPGEAWLHAFGSVAVGGAAILYAGLAWWSRSLTASVIFFVGGAAELLVSPALLTFPGDWPYYLNMTLTWWTDTTTGPVNAAQVLGGALVVAGVIGLYRWAFTRQLALKDA